MNRASARRNSTETDSRDRDILSLREKTVPQRQHSTVRRDLKGTYLFPEE